MYSRIFVMTTRWVRRVDLPTYHKTSPHKDAHYGSGALRGFEREKRGVEVLVEKYDQTFVIRPKPVLLCALQYQSDMAWDHQTASALICWQLGVCGFHRPTFHLAPNLGFTPAPVMRWLTIITPQESWRNLPTFCYCTLHSGVLRLSFFLFFFFPLSRQPT